MQLSSFTDRHPLQRRPVNECAQCGAHIYVAEWSEHLDSNRVRHLWQCDACGYRFETTLRFPAREVEAA